MLQLKSIKKDYKVADSTVHALKGVDLRFRPNEFVSILGPSGCGKTTLLNIIGGLDQYTSGDLIICGVSTKDYKDRDWDVYRNHRIGFVFQSYNLIPHQTILENVEIALTIAGVSKEERRRRATEALEKVGLKEEINKKPNQLSGGQMQRVAIARALVNNPEILLADEPTGALDTKTSVQIMDLIREIAGERLVIMVTHNPELAEQYSTRIVRLQDGVVLSDSNPYDGEEESVSKSECCEYQEETGREGEAEGKPAKKKKEKASMSFKTSLGLSARNLAMKRGRTAVTSIAGSIGIISVCLVLALSNGFNNYILKTQEDMLSSSPVKITRKAIDMQSLMSGLTSNKKMPDLSKLDNKVYVNSFLTSIATGMTVENKINETYVSYLEEMPKEYYEEMQYSYGVNLMDSVFVPMPNGLTGPDNASVQISITALKMMYKAKLQEEGKEYANLADYVSMLGEILHKMPGTSDFNDTSYGEYVLSQYDVLATSEGHSGFPQNENEAVLVIGGNNDMTDLTLAQLGILSQEEFLSYFEEWENGATPAEDYKTVDFSRIIDREFTIYYNDGLYKENPTISSENPYPYIYNYTKAGTDKENSATVKITGILRLKKGLTYGCLNSGLNLTEKLIDEYIQINKTSKIAEYIRANPKTIAASNLLAYADMMTYELKTDEALAALGASDEINSISFYTQSFGTKEKMLSYLDAWNDMCKRGATYKGVTLSGEDEVSYTDSVGIMMSMVESMLNAITYVLVAFTAISLVVSSVMIGIITYVSVVERVKEIGVLRSLGARKQDIKNLFNAETFIIGLASGVFGVAVTYLLSVGINALLGSLTGIATLASLPITSAIVMIVISVCLTLISGLIPAKAAANKDPVVALRTE